MTVPAIRPIPFPHNWMSSVQVETSFLTDITQSAGSVSEERRGLRRRPGRLITARFTAFTREDSARLLLAVLRYNHQANVFPLYCDVSIVTEASTGNTLKCDTSNRRFFIGMWVLVAEHTGKGLTNEQYVQISSITPGFLGVSLITGTIPVGARVYPLVQIDPNLSMNPVLLTDDKVSVEVAVLELLGPSTLPSTAQDSLSRLSFLQWKDGYPIFEFRKDWTTSVRVNIARPGEKYGQGRDQVISLAGSRPKLGFSMAHTFLNRAEFFHYMKFAESRSGRLRPFWMLNPQRLFTPTSVAGNDIVVEAIGNDVEDWNFFERVGVVLSDGTIFISKITNVVLGADITFTLEDAPTFVLADIRRMSTAHLCRFNADAISEEWDTSGIVRMSSDVIEVLNEKDATVTGTFPDPIT